MGIPKRKPRSIANDSSRLPMPSRALPQILLPIPAQGSVAVPHIRHVRLAPTIQPRREFSWMAAFAIFLLGVLIFMFGVVAGTVFWFTYDSADAVKPPVSSPVLVRLAPPVAPHIAESPKPVQSPASIVLPADNTVPAPAAKDDSVDTDTLLIHARMNLEDNENAAALALYERALIQDPENHDALEGKAYALGRLAAKPNAPSAMLKELQRVAALLPDDATTQEALAKALAQRGDMQEAIMHFDRAARLAPNNVTARFDLATAYDRAGKAADALMLYRQILQLSGGGDEPILPPETLAAIKQRAEYLFSVRIQQ